MMKTFGPVPSRRLGKSLGINNIPPKVCTYACVYCQLGRTIKIKTKRQDFYTPEEIVEEVEKRVRNAEEAGEPIDFLTFVSDGEPTLDIHLGQEIDLLQPLGIRVAIITNGSLIWREDVRQELTKADWVSLKVDSTREEVWRKINRPHRSLKLQDILDGMFAFAKMYRGNLVTETMLVKGINDGMDDVNAIAEFLIQLKPAKAYLSIPTRPPAEKWAKPPSEDALNRAFQILSKNRIKTEYLIGYEGNAFAFTGNVEEDLLSITSVHPMREDAVTEFLCKAKADWSVVKKLINEKKMVETEYREKRFYARKLMAPRSHTMLGLRVE